jgi:Fe-S-cluster-containing dehydrogenase component
MVEYALIIDTKDCVGCNACEVACKQEHNLPVGPRWITVRSDSPKEVAGKMQLRYVVAHCVHCSQPMCRDRCPVNAIIRRVDGIILINEELCIGCKGCVDACPLGVMQFDENKGVAGKCDLCWERINIGLKPACVSACPSRCIYYGDISHITEQLSKHRLLVRYKAMDS